MRKGERGSLVVKYGSYTKRDEDAPAGNDEEAETRRFLKGYTVFHVSQIEGIEFPTPENLPELSVTEKAARAREIIAGKRTRQHSKKEVPSLATAQAATA